MMPTAIEDERQILRAVSAGATGYLLKHSTATEIVAAVESLHRGGSPMSERVARKVIQAFQFPDIAEDDGEKLTKREEEILSFLAKGLRDKEIGEKLNISYETVRTHLRNIYKKLHVGSRNKAVLRFLDKSVF